MDIQSLLRLQNGSDVRGVALATQDGPDVNFTAEAAELIARSFALWLSKRTCKTPEELRIGVGHDPRLTAEILKAGIISGLLAEGAAVFDCGLISTPAMFMGTVFAETAFDGAIMITASHLPKNRNGMKFFVREGGLDKPDVTEVLKAAADLGAAGGGGEAVARPCELLSLYSAFLREKILAGVNGGERPLESLKIVVDAGNGGGGFFVSRVLEPLGADCEGSRFLDPDGEFPNHAPNPEDKKAMEAIRGAVVETGADLGIIFDTDVDRMSAVLKGGAEVNRDAIIAMMAAIIAPDNPGATIVTDSVTSDRLTAFLEGELGLKHHRFKRGYKNVINEAVRLNAEGTTSPLAIETSGHGALRENYFLDDGAYMAVRLVIAAAKAKRESKTLASLIEKLAPAGEELEIRMPISGEDFSQYADSVLESFKRRAEQKGYELPRSYEGVRVSFPGKGWLLLRKSLHDPLMPMNLEGVDEEAGREILTAAHELLEGFGRLQKS